jgi:hypothetical protein
VIFIQIICLFVFVMAPTGTGTNRIRSNFWKFYLIKTSFTLDALVFLGESVLDCLDWNRFFSGVRTVDNNGKWRVQHLIYWQGQCVCDALFHTFFQVFGVPQREVLHSRQRESVVFLSFLPPPPFIVGYTIAYGRFPRWRKKQKIKKWFFFSNLKIMFFFSIIYYNIVIWVVKLFRV